MSKDSTFFFYYHKVMIKLQQNRNYAIINTPQYMTRTRTRYKIWWMPEHDAASQLNLAPSRQEVKYMKLRECGVFDCCNKASKVPITVPFVQNLNGTLVLTH